MCWSSRLSIAGFLLLLTSAAPPNPLAVVEADPVAQGPKCHSPMRVRNLTTRTISVTVERSWKQAGPGCNTIGETANMPVIALGPRGTSFLGCSVIFTDGSFCTDHYKFRYVDARR